MKDMNINSDYRLGYDYTLKNYDFINKISEDTIKKYEIVIIGKLKHIIRFRTKELLELNIKLKEY